MPLMSREEHENMLTELLNPEIEHSRRTDILQQLRVDHVTGHSDYEEITKNNDRLRKDNDDLIVSNSKLFRQIGITGGDEKGKEKEEKKEFSETVTLEALEKGV